MTDTIADTIDRLAGLEQGSPTFTTRHEREKVALATQACEDLLLGDTLDTALTQAERLVLASEQARVSGVNVLQAVYRARALALDSAAITPELRTLLNQPGAQTGNARMDAMLHFVRTLALNPAESDQAALLAIPAAGLSLNDTVLLAQLIGFVAYQARLLVGVQAMNDLGGVAEAPAAEPVAAAPFVHPANLPAPGEPLRRNGFTSETLGWKAWLEVLNPETATPEQQHVLEVSHPKAKTMDFYLVLARQPQVLLERSQAFNAIMYAPGGLSRAEREVAATAVSRSNGCVFCASVHARFAAHYSKRSDAVDALLAQGIDADLGERWDAIVAAAAALTATPVAFDASHVARLREVGLDDQEISDVLHAAAFFNWANRLMLSLGEPEVPRG